MGRNLSSEVFTIPIPAMSWMLKQMSCIVTSLCTSSALFESTTGFTNKRLENIGCMRILKREE